MLCVPLTVTSKKEISRFLRAANMHADCVELRLDYFRRVPNLRRLVASCRKPAIVTVRKKAEGGKIGFRYADRLCLYLEAIRLGVAYVDVEFSSPTLVHAVKSALVECRTGTQLIVSYHNFRSTDRTQLVRVYEQMKSLPGAVLKIATKATTIEDNIIVFDLLKQARRDRRKMIALCMGPLGTVSRILALAHGSLLTYAALSNGSAPGQLTLREMKELYRVDRLRDPAVFGLIGNPVEHSTGYVFHNQRFARARKQAVYVNFLVEDLSLFLKAYSGILSGFSVTIPHKEEIVSHLDHVERHALAIGAVNTVVKRGGKLRGYNTDYLGILSSLKEVSLQGKRALVLGAGGVAKAACYALQRGGALITIANRTYRKAIVLADRFGGEALPIVMLKRCEAFDVIVNCTSVGMAPDARSSPLSKSLLLQISAPGTVVFDTIYTPERTLLLKYAESIGLTPLSGTLLFTEQATKQNQLWRNVL